MLDTDAGRLALLYTAARLLHRIDKGDHPDLATPIKKLVETLRAAARPPLRVVTAPPRDER
ncbi:hypothetical protein [Lentzea sp. NPDC004782]|uniref:hypothetical protein n=1 Tax=Lentzea sp. NPDC004782 TaxID=3154458 RepID=UPI0033B51250